MCLLYFGHTTVWKCNFENGDASSDGLNGNLLKIILMHPASGLVEQMAMADMGWEGFLRLTQVSATAQARVMCQLRCIEEQCLPVRSSLTPRSVSSGLKAVTLISLARLENKDWYWTDIHKP